MLKNKLLSDSLYSKKKNSGDSGTVGNTVKDPQIQQSDANGDQEVYRRALGNVIRRNYGDIQNAISDTNRLRDKLVSDVTNTGWYRPDAVSRMQSDLVNYKNQMRYLQTYGFDTTDAVRYMEQAVWQKKESSSSYDSEDKYINAVMSGILDFGSKNRIDEYNRNLRRIKQLDNRISQAKQLGNPYDELQAQRDSYASINRMYERTLKVGDDYGQNTSQSDFSRLSQQRDFENSTAEYAEEYRRRFDPEAVTHNEAGELVNELGEVVNDDLHQRYAAPVVADKLGAFLSGDLDESQLKYNNGRASVLDQAVVEGDDLGWKYLTDEEVGIYYYLLNKEGQKSAYKYLDDMQVTLSRRGEQAYQQMLSDMDGWEMAMANAASIPMNVLGGAVEGIENLGRVFSGYDDDYNPYGSLTRRAGAIRGETAGRIDEATDGANLFGFSVGDAYQGVMSGLDSALGSAIGGHAYTALMGTSAASAEATRLWEAGASEGQIIAGSLTAGAAEVVFEYFSIENFIHMKDPDTISQLIRNILVQGVIEASEEVATELANTLTNGIIMGSQSDWNTEINRIAKENGISRDLAGVEYIMGNIYNAGMGGLVSGATMAALPSTLGYSVNAARQSGIGQMIRNDGGVDALLQLANASVGISSETSTNKEAREQKAAQKELQKALDSYAKKPESNRRLGLISTLTDNLRSTQNRADIVTALMNEAGMNRWQARKAADTITAASEYTADESDIKNYRKLIENDKVSAAVDKLFGDDGSVSFRDLQHRLGRNGIVITRGDNTAAEGSVKAETKNNLVSKIEAAERTAETTGNGTVELKTGETVQSIAPVSNDGGKLTFRVTTDNGETRTVSYDDVVFGSSDQAAMYSVLANLGMDAGSIGALADGYDGTTDLTTYLLGVNEAYTYGRYNLSAERGSFSKDLTEEQRKNAYQRGQIDAGRQVGREVAKIRQAVSEAKKGTARTGGVVYEGEQSDYQNMDDLRDSSVKVIDRLGKEMGITFHLFKSYVNKDGTRVYSNRDGEFSAPNGYYKDGEIWLDVNAGNDGEGVILFTAAHELTHFIRQWSPAKFKTLANFLVQQYGKSGQSVEQLVAAQIQKAKSNGRTLSYDDAFEEMVADSMETMLTDGTALQKMAELRSADRSLWERMRHWWAGFAARIKRLYKNLNPDSDEGKLVRQMSESVEQIQQLFVEGAVDAADNYSMAKTFEADGIATDEAGRTVAVQDENGHSVFSLRTYDESGRKLLQKYLDGRVKSGAITTEDRTDMLRQMDDLADICRKYTGEFATFGNWSNAEIVERNGKPVFSVVKKNGEYALNLDFSLVCKKRRTLDAVFNSMIATGLMDNIDTLAEADISRINDIIREYGFETACALCFVDAKRYRQGLVADAFTGLYNQLVRSMAPEGVALSFFNYGGNEAITDTAGIESLPNSALNFDEINRVLATYGKSTVEYKAAKLLKDNPSQRKLLLRGDFMSTAGLDAVKTQNPAMLKLYNSKKGTGGPKAAESDVQYLSEIISKKSFNIKKAYAVGGVRIQSFSDYVGRLVFDYIQMVGDLAAKELPAHAYTKELSFARQFGKTGIKINMSLVPDVADDGVAPGLDKDGNYLWRDGQSFGSDVKVKGSGNDGFRLAVEIQNADGYGKNCGTIAVGISKQHIEKLLSDPDIRMVIPYHKSSLNHLVAQLNNIDRFTDYTSSQNTKLNGSKLPKGVADFNFNAALQRLGDAKAAANEYLAWCEKNGYTPKFEEFAWHENYYKLLEDFSTYDSDGNAAPQGAVTMTFPTDGDAFGSMSDLIRDGLEEDAILQGNQDDKVPQIVEAIRSEMTARGKVSKNTTEEGGVKYQARDRRGNVVVDEEVSSSTVRKELNTIFTSKNVMDYSFASQDTSIKKSSRNQLDMDYMAAVKAGDMDTVKRLVDEAAMEWGAVTTYENGVEAPMKVYHTTDAEFTRFQRNKLGAMTDGNATDVGFAATSYIGFWFNSGDLREKLMMKNKIAVYVRGTMYHAGNLEGLSIDVAGSNYDSAQEKYDNGSMTIAKKLGTEFRKELELEYDGIQIEDEEMGGTSFVIFDPKNIKSAEPIMYDSKGNVIPISKRFNSDKFDIRYSERDTAAQTTRSLLASMDAEALSNATEQKYLAEYQEADRQIREYQKQIGTMTEDLRELRSGKGKRNMSAIRTLQDEITKAENRVNVLSGKLVRLEGNTAIQRVLNRELKQELQAALKEQADSYENQLLLQEVSSDAEMKAQTALLKADKADALDTQKKKYEAALREQNERLTRKLADLRADKKAALDKQRQKTREQVKTARDNAKQRHGDTLIRHKIQKLAKELNQRLLHPTEKRYVPKEFTKLTVSILDAVNLDTGKSVRLAEKIANLKTQYEGLLKNPTYAMAYDDVFNDLLENLYAAVGDTPINKMTTSQLAMVHDVLRALSDNIRYAARVTIGAEEHDAYELAKEMTDETMAVKGGENIYTKWLQSSLRADVMFDRLAGFKKDSAWSKVARMLDDGQLKVTQTIMEGSQIFADLAGDKMIKTLSDTKNLVDIGLKDDNGNKILITKGMMLSIYMHLQNEQNTRHILSGGLTIPAIKEYYKSGAAQAFGVGHTIARGNALEIARLNEELRNAETDGDREAIQQQIEEAVQSGEAYANSLSAAIEKNLTEYDRKWIKAAKKFFDEYSKEKLNEATMQMYHFEKAKEKNYYPIHTDSNYRTANFESIAKDMSLENAGFMKDRINGANPILLEDITDVINSQLKRTATYVGLAPAIRSFNKIYGKTQKGYANSVQNAVASKFGASGKTWVENLIADLTGSRHGESTIFDRLRGNMAAATLTLNPRVALAQTASFPTAAAEIGWEPVMKALAKGGKNGWAFSRAELDIIQKYSPLLWYRMQGYRDTELGDIRSRQNTINQINSKLRFATGWIQAMDGATVGRLWNAAQYYVDDHYKGLKKGSDEYYKKVAEVYNRVIEKTQPNYTVMQRPDILRNPNALMKQLTMFMTQRLQNFNIVYDAAARSMKYSADLKAGRNGVTPEDVKAARGDVVNAVSSQVAAAVTIAAFKAVADVLLHMMNAYRDDDEELTAESISLNLLDTFANSLVTSTLWGSEVYSAISALVTGKSYDGLSVNALKTITGAIDSISGLKNKIANGTLTVSDFWNPAVSICQYFGIPINNAYKIGRGLYQHAVDIKNGEFFSFEAGVERTSGQNQRLLYQAMLDGDQERIKKFSAAFKNNHDLHNAIRAELREKDSRINDAAKARIAGNIAEYERLVIEIKNEGHFEQDDIVAAVNSAINKIKNDEKEETEDASVKKMYNAKDYLNAAESGQSSTAEAAKDYMVRWSVSHGKTEAEANTLFYTSVRSEIKDRFDEGEYTVAEAEHMLDGYGGMTAEEAKSRAEYYNFCRIHPGYDLSEESVAKYLTVKDYGIGLDLYVDVVANKKNIYAAYEENKDKKSGFVAYLDSLPISRDAKIALYLLYYKESTIKKDTPW